MKTTIDSQPAPVATRGFRDLRIWQEATSLTAEIIQALDATNRNKFAALNEHIVLTAIGLAERIAEAYMASAPTEQRSLYQAARSSTARLETDLVVLQRAGLISEQQYGVMSSQLQTVKRLLVSFLVYFDAQREGENRSQ